MSIVTGVESIISGKSCSYYPYEHIPNVHKGAFPSKGCFFKNDRT